MRDREIDVVTGILNDLIDHFNILEVFEEQDLLEFIKNRELNRKFYLYLLGSTLDLIKLHPPKNSGLIVKSAYRLLNFCLNIMAYPLWISFNLIKVNKYPEYWTKARDIIKAFNLIKNLNNHQDKLLELSHLARTVNFKKLIENNKEAFDVICAGLESEIMKSDNEKDKLEDNIILSLVNIIKDPENVRMISSTAATALLVEHDSLRNPQQHPMSNMGMIIFINQLLLGLDKPLHSEEEHNEGLITVLNKHKDTLVKQLNIWYFSDDPNWKWMRDIKLHPDMVGEFLPLLDDFETISKVMEDILSGKIIDSIEKILYRIQTLPKLRIKISDPDSNIKSLFAEFVVDNVRNNRALTKELDQLGFKLEVLLISSILLKDLDFSVKLVRTIKKEMENAKNTNMATIFSMMSSMFYEYARIKNIPTDYMKKIVLELNSIGVRRNKINFEDALKVANDDAALAEDVTKDLNDDKIWLRVNELIGNRNLDYVEFINSDLKNLVIEYFTFKRTNFDLVAMTNSDIRNCLFIDGNLRNAIFFNTKISDTKFINCKFEAYVDPKILPLSWLWPFYDDKKGKVSFREAELENVSFKNSIFEGDNINFKNAKLTKVDFTGAVTKNVIDFTGATIDEYTLKSIRNNPGLNGFCRLPEVAPVNGLRPE